MSLATMNPPYMVVRYQKHIGIVDRDGGSVLSVAPQMGGAVSEETLITAVNICRALNKYYSRDVGHTGTSRR